VNDLRLMIITGLSGSGKSTVIDVLEDSGFYCVDGLPVALLPLFLTRPFERTSAIAGLAFGMDVRERRFVQDYPGVFDSLRRDGHHLEIIFLEADEKVLLQRFSQTRRLHPLRGQTLIESIRTEKAVLGDLRAVADHVIDTTTSNVHELKTAVHRLLRSRLQRLPMRIQVMSFGYKYGPPPEADLLVDVRFLNNPYFQDRLRHLDGETPDVREFVFADPHAEPFLDKLMDWLAFVLPLYEKEGKAYLTIAVGCTGGRHRSVAMARALFERLARRHPEVGLTHRDIGQDLHHTPVAPMEP
jgi:UPF0042 nucleotide-binding protein